MARAMTARAILERLVAFPTVSSRGNLDLVEWVEDYLDGFGVRAHRDPGPDGRNASLFANVGPERAGGIVLSGHSDVVPVEGQSWTTDPWTLTERDGRLYGRGACDMKGFVAMALAAVPMALDRDLRRPLQIAISRDEEVGCVGAPPMLRAMAGLMPTPALAIIGEPSMMKVVTGHKGGTGYKTHVRGFEVHSSIMHRGVNAIMAAGELIHWANLCNDRNRARTPDALAALFDPPWTTVHVGTISGGTAHNITAADCRLGMDFRCVPGEDVEDWARAYEDRVAELDATLKAVHPEAGISLDRYFTVPALLPEPDGAAEALARRLTGDNGSHVVSYGTEAGQFQAAGISAVVCGPGDIAQAHQPDEYITLAQFAAGEALVAGAVDALCD